MKLSEELLTVFRAIIKMNGGSPSQGALFQSGSIVKHRRFRVNMPIMEAKIPEEIPQNFAIADVNKFLAVHKSMKNPDVNFAEKYIKLTSESKDKQAKFKYADTSFFKNRDNGKTVYDDVIEIDEYDVNFEISKENFKSILTSCNVFVSSSIAIVGDGKNLFMRTYNEDDPTADGLVIRVGESDKKFTFILNIENLPLIEQDFKISVSFRGLVSFESELLTYWVTVSEKSKVG